MRRGKPIGKRRDPFQDPNPRKIGKAKGLNGLNGQKPVSGQQDNQSGQQNTRARAKPAKVKVNGKILNRELTGTRSMIGKQLR